MISSSFSKLELVAQGLWSLKTDPMFWKKSDGAGVLQTEHFSDLMILFVVALHAEMFQKTSHITVDISAGISRVQFEIYKQLKNIYQTNEQHKRGKDCDQNMVNSQGRPIAENSILLNKNEGNASSDQSGGSNKILYIQTQISYEKIGKQALHAAIICFGVIFCSQILCMLQ